VTIPNRLIFYIGEFTPTIFPLGTPPHFTSSYGKRFHCSISYRCMKSVNHVPSLYSRSPSALPQVPPTHCTYFIVLSLLISKSMFRGFSMYSYCEYTLLWSIQPLPLLSFTPSIPPTQFRQHSRHVAMSPICTDVML
jgi:hypothetical protein